MQKIGAEVILECLIEQQVEKVFGYPGGAILPFYDALLKYPQIEHILTVHEQGAAHAADAYARVSGKVGVCVATSGPGATNLITGIANAFLDSVPMIVITGQVPTQMIGGDVFQEVDITGISMPITKHNFLIKHPNQLADTIRLAFNIAQSGRPGPVLIDIPRDVQTSFMDYQQQQPIEIKVVQPDLVKLETALGIIQAAKRPVVLIGGGVINAGAKNILQKLIEKTKLPVVSSLMGLSGIDGDNPCFLGMSGLHGQEAANRAVAASDVLLAVGCRFNDRVTGNKHIYAQDKQVIHFDIDYAEVDKNINTCLGIIGDLAASLTYLNDNLEYQPKEIWWECIRNWEATKTQQVNSTQLYFMLLSEIIYDKNIIVCTDVGQHQMWAAQNIKLKGERTFITSGGLGSMGFGIPAAMGAAFAKPEKPTICISGDGGFKMTSHELYTIARYNLPVISIVMNNQALGMIKQLQTVQFEERFSQCCLPAKFNYQKYAEAFGISGYQVKNHQEFEQVLKNALQEAKPCIIEVVLSTQDMVMPMVKPGLAINEFVKF
ncbi:biosynthetic-type acetolactate synthase large subunit [Succinispira mobilis]|uniref:biosynthetic-type acetolactate synthase large subunit n=1 Tax=Succinispira mobilis TaxID=78120 RepID=UPI0003654B83|nr:biosynthetic-type acetolactate synthase large subunit [Succinispira mobilis]